MEAIRSRNLELETENEEMLNGLKSLNNKISILESLNDDNKYNIHENYADKNAKVLLAELKSKFNEIQNKQNDLNNHIELNNKKLNNKELEIQGTLIHY